MDVFLLDIVVVGDALSRVYADHEDVAGNGSAWLQAAQVSCVHFIQLLLGEVYAVHLDAVAIEFGILVDGVVVIALGFCLSHYPLELVDDFPGGIDGVVALFQVCQEIVVALEVDVVEIILPLFGLLEFLELLGGGTDGADAPISKDSAFLGKTSACFNVLDERLLFPNNHN